MTDQELLERAASAAGYDYFVDSNGFIQFVWEEDNGEAIFKRFDPLENDGDAFRLMHTLGLEPMSGETELDEPIYTVIGMGLSYNESPTCERHDIAGLRRAIVRAAAAMADDQ